MVGGFENPELLGLLVLALPGLYLAVRHDQRFRKIVSASNSILIVLLVLSAASPFINAEESTSKQPQITVLRDESTSADVLEEAEIEMENVEIREKVIASGNSSDLRHGMLRNLEPDKAYLAVSDFQSSSKLHGVADRFRSQNSTLNALKVETEDESSVKINGPESTVPGATNRFKVKVRSTSEIPEPEVTLDGETVELERTGNSTWSFTRTFSERGEHRVKASISTSDEFSQNNQYFHVVEVNKKPKILVLGEEGNLGDQIKNFYEVEHRSSLPEDLSPYYTVIMKKDPAEEPVEYVSRGNGVVYTADYKEELNTLPVKKVPESEQNKGAKVVLAIDISQGTGEEGTSKRIKQVAFNLVETLPFNNRVGAVAYNRDAYVMEKPESLAKNRDQLMQKISRLKPSGPSLHDNGIRGAKELLNGTGNIIMVTDGRIGGLGQNRDTGQKSRRLASELEVQLITVGVGDRRDENFLRDLANRGNGFYLDAEDSSRLQFQFEAGGAAGETVPLVIVNPDHFITDGLESSSSTSFFNSVEPRKGANLLVTGTNGKPFLSSWRYGLGRVAAFSGGESDLSQVSRTNPLMVTRTVSWSVGDPKRKQDKWLEIGNSRRPEEVKARSSYAAENFKRQGDNLYTSTLEPEETGFYEVAGKSYGYSYNSEIEKIGYSDSMEDIVRATGGNVYSTDQKQEIREDLQHTSKDKIVTKKPLSSYLLVLALLVFLGEVGYRKMNGKK